MATNRDEGPLYLDLNISINDLNKEALYNLDSTVIKCLQSLMIAAVSAKCPGCHCSLEVYINLLNDNPNSAVTDEVVIKEEPEIICTDLLQLEHTGNFESHVSESQDETIDREHAETHDDISDFDYEPTTESHSLTKAKKLTTKKSGSSSKNIDKPAKYQTKVQQKLCSFCYQVFGRDKIEEYKSHVANHDLTCYKCSIPTEFKTFDTLRKHVKRKHFSLHPKFSSGQDCPKCGKRYINSRYPTHVKRCPGKPECNICGRVCKDWPSLQSHIKGIHEGITSYICDVCGSKFVTKNGLALHSQNHGERKLYECDLCKKTFKTRYMIVEHMRKVHLNTVLLTYPCDECGKEFHSKQTLNTHKINHLETKPHTCKTCGKSFAKRYTMLKHEMIHSDIRKCVCSICYKMFRDITGLIAHTRLHTGEQPYECTVCQRRFHDRGCYRTHLMRHEREMGITLDKSIRKFRRKLDQPPHVSIKTDTS